MCHGGRGSNLGPPQANRASTIPSCGAISLPNLADTIKTGATPFSWADTLQLMLSYTQRELSGRKSDYYPARIKQWFSYLNRQYPEADALFRELRIYKTTEDIVRVLEQAQQHLSQ